MSEIGKQQHKVEELKSKILEIQEIAEELEEAFPRGESESDKSLNSISRKLTDRLSAAHDLSLKLGVELGSLRVEELRETIERN